MNINKTNPGIQEAYAELKFIMTQAGTAVPTGNFLNNTLLPKQTKPSFERSGTGQYNLHYTGGFNGILFFHSCLDQGPAGRIILLTKISTNTINMIVTDATGTPADLEGIAYISVEVWPN